MDRYDGAVQDAPTSGLEARLSELSQERDHFRKLYLETLERCALLERGIIAGSKAERFTADGPQLTLGVLGLLLTPETPQEPETRLAGTSPGVPAARRRLQLRRRAPCRGNHPQVGDAGPRLALAVVLAGVDPS